MRSSVFILLSFFIVQFPERLLAQETPGERKLEWYGYVGSDFRYFHDEPLDEEQESSFFSSIFKPQLFFESKNGKHQINFLGFARLDQYDTKRTHVDIRDLYWRYTQSHWEFNAGIKTITWGKTESNHLVDIINQYDLLEGRTLKEKLGQPMLQISFAPKYFTLELITTTYLREIEFPGSKGRLRPGSLLGDAQYTLKNGRHVPDFALRLSKSFKSFDVAISNFNGTNRLPYFKADAFSFTPVYKEINQSGLELQWIVGAFSTKHEAVYLIGNNNNVVAFTSGVEYNLLLNGGLEIKLLNEYTYDQRGRNQISGLQNDIFLGFNFAFNDVQSTNLNLGAFIDVDYGTIIIRPQFERRLGKSWKVNASYTHIANTSQSDFYYQLRNDSFIEISILNFF